MAISKNNKTKSKASAFIYLGIFIVILIMTNIAGQFLFKRFDLTTDHRYSLNEFSKKQLSNLDDIVFRW